MLRPAVVRNAAKRLAATEAKVSLQAAQDKKARAIAEVWERIRQEKRKRERDMAEAQDASPPAKQWRAATGAETGPANEANAAQKKKSFQYFCPACEKAVTSQIRTGQVDHRRACGNTFSVRDGQVAEKSYAYVCPACKGKVASNVKTGKIDHRRICGNRFSVKDGVVQEKAYAYVCPACKGKVKSNVRTGHR